MIKQLLTLLTLLFQAYDAWARKQEALEHQSKGEQIDENPAEFLADHFGSSRVQDTGVPTSPDAPKTDTGSTGTT